MDRWASWVLEDGRRDGRWVQSIIKRLDPYPASPVYPGIDGGMCWLLGLSGPGSEEHDIKVSGKGTKEFEALTGRGDNRGLVGPKPVQDIFMRTYIARNVPCSDVC
ncbi:hypothetical protein HGRIS_013595 [Hohenbuehelia grisea]|uniref:Uncharacterized protein n=1 Tax=Hohenbuehelia grisea TaxID=104357 RepID=A0ABR3IW58_9AGAR